MKGLIRAISRGPAQRSPIRRQRIVVKNKPIQTTGLSGVGWGTAVLGDLPDGNILFLGAIAYLQFTKLSAGTIATFDGDVSIGTAPTADNALAGAEVDLLPSTPLNAATASVSPMVRLSNATQSMLDNTDGAMEINMNLLLDDASVSADAQDFLANGFVDLAYIVLGDD